MDTVLLNQLTDLRVSARANDEDEGGHDKGGGGGEGDPPLGRLQGPALQQPSSIGIRENLCYTHI